MADAVTTSQMNVRRLMSSPRELMEMAITRIVEELGYVRLVISGFPLWKYDYFNPAFGAV